MESDHALSVIASSHDLRPRSLHLFGTLVTLGPSGLPQLLDERQGAIVGREGAPGMLAGRDHWYTRTPLEDCGRGATRLVVVASTTVVLLPVIVTVLAMSGMKGLACPKVPLPFIFTFCVGA